MGVSQLPQYCVETKQVLQKVIPIPASTHFSITTCPNILRLNYLVLEPAVLQVLWEGLTFAPDGHRLWTRGKKEILSWDEGKRPAFV